jgi:histidine ammonia-lyase
VRAEGTRALGFPCQWGFLVSNRDSVGLDTGCRISRVILDRPLAWSELVAVASGMAPLELSAAARGRIDAANDIVHAIVDRDIRGYGVNTGVGALSDVIIPREQLCELSRNILMSHAVGVGTPLDQPSTRAMMAAAVNLFALGFSGVRLLIVQRLIDLLNADCSPEIPHQGSVGYISHRAHIGLLLIGHGNAVLKGAQMPAAEALARLGLAPLILEAKEGLALVNGTPCVAGLGCVALERARHLMAWADAVAAMTFETQRCQIGAVDAAVMALHASPGLRTVAATMRRLLSGSAILATAIGRKTQDSLSLRAIPHVHGAVRDSWAAVAAVVDRELASFTDNPAVMGSVEAPQVLSEAHAVGAAIGLAMDQLTIAMAQLGMMSERRLDRMVNPLTSGLPAFLAQNGGTASGFMIAQYTSASLVAENRRLAAPASLDGGVTSGLQEDMLCHATPGALKALDVIGNAQKIVAIELAAVCQSYDMLGAEIPSAPRTLALYQAVRARIPTYADDRPLGEDIAAATQFIVERSPEEWVTS